MDTVERMRRHNTIGFLLGYAVTSALLLIGFASSSC